MSQKKITPDQIDVGSIATSDLNNDAAFIDSAGAPVQSVNGQTGTVALDIDDVAPTQTGNNGKFLQTNGTTATWQTGGTGTVTSVGTGTGLTGGAITTTGTISLDSASIASLALADTSLQPGGALGTPSSGTLTNCTFPTLNQNTTGSAATLTTSRNINGVAFNGSADITVTAAAGTLTGTTLNATVVTSSLTSLGTIATGVWQGTVVGPTYGGTGVNNGSSTITLAGNLVTSGANSLTLTTTGATNVTLPTSGTLVNSAVTTLSSLVSVGTITTGVWSGTAVAETKGGTNQTSYTTGDILYASGSNTLAKRAIGSTGDVLTVAGGVPTWAAPAAGGGATMQYITSNYTNATTSSTNVFTGVTSVSNGVYLIEAGLNAWNAGASFTQFYIVAPTSSTTQGYVTYADTAAVLKTARVSAINTALRLSTSIADASDNDSAVTIWAVVVTSTTTGTVTLGASTFNAAGTTTVTAPSWIRITKLN